eukprot:scaffold76016_cov51-Attheya_sp.AAC.2
MARRRCIGRRHKNGTGNNSKSSRLTPIPPRALQQSRIDPLLSSVDDSSQAELNMPVGVPSQPPSVTFSNTTPQPSACSIPPPTMIGTMPTSHHLASPMVPLLSNRESHNHYGGIVDVNRLTPSQQEQLDTMIIQQYHAVCNTNEDSSTFVSTPAIPTIESLSQSTVSSLETRGSRSSTSAGTTSSSRLRSESSSRTNSSCSRASRRNVSAHAPVAPLMTALDPPVPQDLSNVFAASGLSSYTSTSSAEYKRSWRKAQAIKESILSAGDTTEECSKALVLALTHPLMKPIFAISGAIVPPQFASAIQFQEQKAKLIKCATSNRSKRKQTDDRQAFVNTNILSVVNSPTTKRDKHEVAGVQHLLGCSLSAAYRCCRRELSTKRGYLRSESTNPNVKWAIKPRGVRVKKVSLDLRARLLQWIMKNPNVCQSPITRDTLIIKDVETGVKRSIPKLLLECSMRQLHNEMIAPPDQGGLQGARHHTSNDVISSDTMLRSLVPPELRHMTDRHKIMCGCTICNTSKYLQTSLNAWRRKHMKHMEVQANASRSRSKATLLEAYTTYADFVFPDNEHRHPRCENSADSVLCAPTTEYSLPKWKCGLRQCQS